MFWLFMTVGVVCYLGFVLLLCACIEAGDVDHHWTYGTDARRMRNVLPADRLGDTDDQQR